MPEKPKKQKLYVRPTPEARHALRRLLTALQAPTLFGDELLQEDFVAATWLWMAEMKVADVVEGVRPHILAVQAHWAKPVTIDQITPDELEDVRAQAKAKTSAKPKAPKKRRG